METPPKNRITFLLSYICRRSFRYTAFVFITGLCLGRIVLTNHMSPFGLSFIAAAAMAGPGVHAAYLSAMIGSALLSGLFQLEPLCAMTLFYALHLVWQRTRPQAGRYERLFLYCIAAVVFIPVFHYDGLSGLTTGLTSAGLGLFALLAMQMAIRTVRQIEKRHVLSDTEQICISAFFGLLLLSVTDVQGFGFSLPVVLLLSFSMVAALARGIAGVAVSVALGAVLTIGGEFALSFVGSLAACTLAGAALRKTETLGVLGGFICCSLLVGTYVFTASHTINLINLAVAGAIFLLIPRDSMLLLCSYLDAEKNRERYARKALRRLRERTAEEILHTAAVCREMANLFQPMPMEKEPSDALMQWTAQAAYGVCQECMLRVYCWQDASAAAAALYETLLSHERGERLRIRKPFDPSCKHMPQMAAAAWQAQNQYLVERATRKETAEQYAFVNSQFTGMSQVMHRLSERVLEDRWLDEELEKLLMRGLDRRGIRALSVDASYPDARLQIHLCLSTSYLSSAADVMTSVEAVLRRGMRLLSTHTDGRTCILIMEEAAKLSTQYGTAGQPLTPEGVSGDSTGERRLDRGRVLYALSDGMGAGEHARLESESAIRTLFDFYSVGLPRDVTLKSVNKLLLERKTDMYATLDAVSIDLFSGEAEFIKYGAPPTFILRGKRVHEVVAESPPAGIVPDAVPAISKASLISGDAVVLLSDGTLDALGEGTSRAIVETIKAGESAKSAAASLLKRARELGQEDDMTVMVIKIA